MDFVTTAGSFHYDLKKMIYRDHDYHVIHITSPAHIFRYIRDLYQCMRLGRYDVIHIHKNSLANPIPILVARLCSDSPVILHSHNTKPSTGQKLAMILHYINKLLLSRLSVKKIACSKIAGQWLFLGSNFSVLHNAIDVDRFAYNEEVRQCMRKELGLENCFVIGSVARISDQKNQLFMLDVLKDILPIKPETVLVLVGGPLSTKEGEAYDREVKHKVNALGLTKSVRFLGVREDSNRIYQALDVFFLPSKYEGLCISAIEAQASGLPCVVSNVLPDETKVSSDYKALSLSDSISAWADCILSYQNHERRDKREILKQAGYDMQSSILDLEHIYRELSDRKEAEENAV